MKKNNTFLINSVLIGMLFLLACIIGIAYNKNQNNGALTMQEAKIIADTYAKQWQDDAIVVSIISSDNQDAPSDENGIKGKRNCWLFSYKSNLNRKQYAFYLVNGEIFNARESSFPYYAPIYNEWISIDSSDAYKLAVENGMQGGKEWAWGYHYILQYLQNVDTKEIALQLSVRGVNENGNEMIVNINPQNGKVTEVQEKVGYDESGRSIWNSTIFADSTVPVDENKTLSRQEIQEKYNVLENAEKNNVLPEELTDQIIKGFFEPRFSPYEDITIYSQNEWEKIMKRLYSD